MPFLLSLPNNLASEATSTPRALFPGNILLSSRQFPKKKNQESRPRERCRGNQHILHLDSFFSQEASFTSKRYLGRCRKGAEFPVQSSGEPSDSSLELKAHSHRAFVSTMFEGSHHVPSVYYAPPPSAGCNEERCSIKKPSLSYLTKRRNGWGNPKLPTDYSRQNVLLGFYPETFKHSAINRIPHIRLTP